MLGKLKRYIRKMEVVFFVAVLKAVIKQAEENQDKKTIIVKLINEENEKNSTINWSRRGFAWFMASAQHGHRERSASTEPPTI